MKIRNQALIVLLGLCLGSLIPVVVVKAWMISSQPKVEFGDFNQVVIDYGNELVLFTKVSCQFCKLEKEYLHSNNIAFKEVSLDDNPKDHQYFHELGEEGVPVLISSKKKLVGYNSSSLDKYFERE